MILLQPHQPPYASCVFFELYKEKSFYMKIFYKNSTETENISPLYIPNCGTKCSLANFYELYEEVLPTDSYEEECKLRDVETLSPDESSEIDDFFEEFASFFDIFGR